MIKYDSIEAIKLDFGFVTDDISEIKRNIKELIKEIHPDKNDGEFKNKLDEINYHKLLSALEYLDQSFEIVPKSQLNALMAILKDGSPVKKEESESKALNEKIDRILKSYHESNLVPKISSTIVSAFLTFLWLFPSTVKNHPILSKYFNPTNIFFSAIWVYSIIITCIYWLMIKRKEQRVKEVQKKLNLESIQNRLFEAFIRHKSYRVNKENRESVLFCEDELIEDLTSYNIFTLNYESRQTVNKRHVIDFIAPFVNSPKNIELELAQNLAVIMIERAKRKGLIELEQDQRMSDTYRYDVKQGG